MALTPTVNSNTIITCLNCGHVDTYEKWLDITPLRKAPVQRVTPSCPTCKSGAYRESVEADYRKVPPWQVIGRRKIENAYSDS